MPTIGSGDSYLARLKGGKKSEQSLPSLNPNRPAPASFHVRMPRPAAASSRSQSSGMFSAASQGLSPRGGQLQSYDELPTTTSGDEASINSTDEIPKKPSRHFMRAAEGGKGSVLPDFNALQQDQQQPKRELPNRMSTRSSPSLAQTMKIPGTGGWKNRQTSAGSNGTGLPQTQMDAARPQAPGAFEAVKQSIRRRTASYLSDDEDGGAASRRAAAASPYRDRRRGRGGRISQKLQNIALRLKLGHLLQVGIAVAVVVLVWESHHKAMFAAQQLQTFKQEESLLLLHLQKIEQHSLSLHENLARLAKSGKGKISGGSGDAAAENVDYDLIHKQTQQLYQMEEELSHEVQSLQSRIQQSARNHIIQAFGEGPVQVILELDFKGLVKMDAESSRISILLWHDTPHAAWTWLDQVTKHVWDGADFAWNEAHVIDAVPHQHQHEPTVSNKVEFVEQGQHSHEAWTVGLKELEETGALGMYINLQDNTQYHRHEVCVGKVIEGFDALQKLLEVSRGSGKDGKHPSIRIKSATAMHVTHKADGP